jgi:PAS domain S-box-containing protein
VSQQISDATLAEIARIPEMNPGPALRVDTDGTVRLANSAARQVFGDEVVGSNWLEVLPGMDKALWAEAVESTELLTVENRIDEHYYLFRHRYDPEGKHVFVFGADISEQKQAEELANLLLNSSGEGMYGIDLTGVCTFANPASAKLLGFESVDDLLGKNMHKLVHHTRSNGQHYPIEECQIYQAFRKGEGTHIDNEVMFCADGNSFQCEYWSYPMIRDDEVVGCVVTFADISDRRRIENELRQTEKMAALGKLSAGLAHELNNPAAAASRAANQIRERVDELQAVTIELAGVGVDASEWGMLISRLSEYQELAVAMGDLSPVEASDREETILEWLDEHDVEDGWAIAADFVSTGIDTKHLDALADDLRSAPLDRALTWLWRSITAQNLSHVVERSAESISELVGRVKSYSHMDKAPSLYVNVHDGLEDTLAIMNHKLKHGIEVVREFDRELPQVQAQGNELNQVWTNLIDNAVSAMDGKGRITIKTYCDHGDVTVAIADNGPGIPKDIQHRIFEPFFTTKDVGEGTGLGLDVVNRIITNRCGGRIDLESSPGNTEFKIRIPVDPSCSVGGAGTEAKE